jgi:hypothetical protein
MFGALAKLVMNDRLSEPWNLPNQYTRALAALARFYNSQVTVHVGYLLTSFVGLLALFSLTREWIQGGIYFLILLFPSGLLPIPLTASETAIIWTAMVFLVILGAYLIAPLRYPVCFGYFLGRTQYYICLSEIIWTHMGITTRDRIYVERLMNRILANDELNGIRAAVMRTFELYLCVSICLRKHTVFDPSWFPAFSATKEDISAADFYYNRRILRAWNLADLLTRLYRHSLQAYENSNKAKELKLFEIFESLGVVKRKMKEGRSLSGSEDAKNG